MPPEDEDNLEDILVPPEAASEGEAPGPDSPPEVSQEQVGGAPVPSPAVSSLSGTLVDRAKAAGLPLDGIDSGDKLAEFVLDRYLQDRAYADLGRASLTRNTANSEVQERGSPHRGEQDAVEEGFDEEGHFTSLWKSGELDSNAKYALEHGLVVLGEDGIFQAKPGYEQLALPVLNQINQVHLDRQSQVKALFEGNFYQNLDKSLWPVLEHRINKMVNERMQGGLSSYQQEQAENSFIEKFQEDNKVWLYTADGRLSPDGQKFSDTVAELRNNGINDPKVLAQYAIKIAGINTDPRPAQEQQLRQRDGQGRYLPAGTPAPAPTKQETFLDKARKHVTASESRNLSVENNSEYQIANEGELENMFTNAWKQAAVG